MSLLLHNPRECPPGYFRYVVPETGRRFPDPETEPGKHYLSLEDLLSALFNHYQANRLPVPPDLSRLVQDQLCRLLPPDRCYYESPEDKRVPVLKRFTFEQVIAGTKTLIGWQLQGRPKAGIDEINRRSEICVRCPYNSNPEGCATCNSPLTALVNSFVGSSNSAYENAMRSCQVCGCSLKALVQMPLETIAEHLTTEQKEALPDYCWQKGT